MKFVESIFDVGYLIFAIASGIYILINQKSKAEKYMGIATLVLGIGDSFHLVPRVLNYFIDRNFSASLGLGKLVTSLTMTAFYLLLYYVYRYFFNVRKNQKIKTSLFTLALLRLVLCLLPQNRWLENEGSMLMGLLRNIPFVLIGLVIIRLYHKKKDQDETLGMMWLLISLSFIFYIPVAVFASVIPMLGMLMLPKTICYIIMITRFIEVVNRHKKAGN